MGVRFSPYFPIITDIFRIIYYATYEPNKLSFTEMIERREGIPEVEGIMLAGMPVIFFCNSKALDELYVTKNAFYTKHPIER